jgi:NADH-quinone oxidoreductase subunit F
MPIYKEAPVSLELLKKHPDRVFAALAGTGAGKRRIVVPRDSERFIPSMSGMEVIAAEAEGGFVYGSRSAVKNISSGERPIPFGTNGEENIFTVEELIDTGGKMAYVDGSVPKAGIYSFGKTITPQIVLEQCGAESFKAMYFGYPMGRVVSADQLNEHIDLATDYIIVYGERDCMLDSLLRIEERYRLESCGRCVFGNEGVKQVCMILSDISAKKGRPGDIDILVDLCGEMRDQSLCEIGAASASTVLSMIGVIQ